MRLKEHGRDVLILERMAAQRYSKGNVGRGQ